jgi:hypothetical protein
VGSGRASKKRGAASSRTVEELIELWTTVAGIRDALRERLARAQADRSNAAAEIAAAEQFSSPEVARLLRELHDDSVTYESAQLAELDKVLRGQLKRAPWKLLLTFSDPSSTGTSHERIMRFDRAMIWLERLAELRRDQLEAARWRPGNDLPATVGATPGQQEYRHLGATAAACARARDAQLRFHGESRELTAPEEMGLTVVRELHGEKVAGILFGVDPGTGPSPRSAAAHILGACVGLRGSAVLKTIPQVGKSTRNTRPKARKPKRK